MVWKRIVTAPNKNVQGSNIEVEISQKDINPLIVYLHEFKFKYPISLQWLTFTWLLFALKLVAGKRIVHISLSDNKFIPLLSK